MTIKTIRMPTAMLAATLAALRSGKYEQGNGALHYRDPVDGSEKFCCLGVMQMAIDGTTETGCGLPSPNWLQSKGITFSSDGHRKLEYHVKAATEQAPFLPTLGCNAWEANDIGCAGNGDRATAVRKTFDEIADAWEAAAEGY